MLRAVNTLARRAPLSRTVAVRSFSSQFETIPTDGEQQWGRRRIEYELSLEGKDAFSSKPIIPAADAGTKENPILVPSGLESRTVGFEDPFTHQIIWFNLKKGPLHLVEEVNLYFKLVSA